METIVLTREQQHAKRHLLRGIADHLVQTLGGYAGTGKTRLLTALAERLPDWCVCAFTGKAASVLRRRGVKAETIHSCVYRPVEDEDGRFDGFRLRTPDEFHYAGILVDEASMVGKEIYRDLLSFGKPIIAFGDHGQLPPIGEDIGLMKDPDYRLERIHRNAGPVAFFAEHLRKGKPAHRFAGDPGVQVQRGRRVGDGLLDPATQIIVGFNRDRCALNERVRHAQGYRGPVQKGERIICLRNNRKLGLYNGMQGVVTKVRRGDRLDFRCGAERFRGICFDPDQFGREKLPGYDDFWTSDDPLPFDWAYCITCHKAQGDEFAAVLVLEQHWERGWPQPRWNYTAASRAKESVCWLAPPRRVPVRSES